MKNLLVQTASTALRVIPGARRIAGSAALGFRTAPHSSLMVADDISNWVLSEEAREVGGLARGMGIRVVSGKWRNLIRSQSIFYSSQFSLNDGQWMEGGNRVGFTYLHGLPGTEPAFDACYDQLKAHHDRIHRIQTSHSEMHNVVLESGIDPTKVHLIRIGINLDFFPVQTQDSRREMRRRYGVPESAVVIGSFQKDGEGWGHGMTPKPVKGPDVLLDTLAILKRDLPGLHVLLSGPARGFVKAGLDKLGISYTHVVLDHYPDVGNLFQCLDAYIVGSRQEGGPKAILESMAAGVPLVTTRVGQAMDLVDHGVNAWMTEVEDTEALAHWTLEALSDTDKRAAVLAAGRQTAEANTYASQKDQWRRFFTGFVEF